MKLTQSNCDGRLPFKIRFDSLEEAAAPFHSLPRLAFLGGYLWDHWVVWQVQDSYFVLEPKTVTNSNEILRPEPANLTLMPALLHMMSTPPNVFSAAANAASMSSILETSHLSNKTSNLDGF
jgi:hypothetical protein